MAGEAEREDKQRLSGRSQGCPRDLLRQFSGTLSPQEEAGTEEDSGEVELSLGLSLGGCFGVDPARKMGLHRSSSVAAIPVLQRREEEPAAVTLLKRTSSLPAEAEEEQRKRKELQCLGMEAKRKKSSSGQAWARDLTVLTAEEERDGGGCGVGRWLAPNGLSAAAVSQGSVGSQGSSSSGVSDFGGGPPKREELMSNGSGQWRSSLRIQALPGLTKHSAPAAGKPKNFAVKEEEVVDSQRKDPAAAGINRTKGVLEEMPCVSTKGSGPNGRRVEGFLYRYGKGEEVSIVCVCHGRFLSPAEFVRHAGGGDVAHPLRHIIVNPSL